MKKGNLLFGAVLGVAIGWLTSPKSGKENREAVKKNAINTYDYLKGLSKEEFVEKLQETMDDVKTAITEFNYRNASAEAKEAYKKFVERFEELVEEVKENQQVKEISTKIKVETLKVADKAKDWTKNILNKTEEEIVEEMTEALDEIEEISEDLYNN